MGRFRNGPRGPCPPPPLLWFIKISALHLQYGIQTFAKFKHPECTRFNTSQRTSISKKFSWRSMHPKLPEKFAIRSPDGQYYAHIDSVYYIYRPPLSKNLSSAPVYSSACTRYESQVMWSSRLSVSNVSVILLVQLRPSLTRGTHKLTILHASKSIV